MCRIYLLFIILYLSLHHAHQTAADVKTIEPNNHFDILVFSQEYSVAICKYWQDQTGRQCEYPKQKNQWNVHGIWPEKFSGDTPGYCNHSGTFDPEEIKLLEGDLNQTWANIYKDVDPYQFWRHEWLKHGSCGTDLEALNSPFKYFSKGIEWNKKYQMTDMLEAANIFPDDTKKRNPEEFVNAVKARTNKTAQLGCWAIKGVLYTEELRICFDKQFNVIDCMPAIDQNCYDSNGVLSYPIYPVSE